MDTTRHRASRPKITKNAQSTVGTLRHSLRMTQAEFATAMGVSVTTVSQWERGALTPSRTDFEVDLTRSLWYKTLS